MWNLIRIYACDGMRLGWAARSTLNAVAHNVNTKPEAELHTQKPSHITFTL